MCTVYQQDTDDRPLDDARTKLLKHNVRNMSKLLKPENGLLEAMESKGCITDDHRLQLQGITQGGVVARNRRLIEMMQRRSVKHYNDFIQCLQDTGHEDTAKLLKVKGGMS